MDTLLHEQFTAVTRCRAAGGAYLASNTMGVIPRRAMEAELACLQAQAEFGVEVWDPGGPWGQVLSRYAAVIGRMVDVSPEFVCPVTNITDGLWRVFSCFNFGEGRGILTSALCFTTQEYASWGFARRGANVTVVPSDAAHHTVPLERMQEAIRQARPAVVHLSHAAFESSFLHDVRAIADTCHEVGAVFCLDAAQTGFVIPFTLAETGADVVLLQQHKWGCAGTGAACLVATPDFCRNFSPSLVGWMSHGEVFSFQRGPAHFAADASRFTGGTPDVPSKARGAAAAELLVDEVGLAAVRAQNLKLGQQLIEGLSELGMGVIEPSPRGAFVAVQCESPAHAHHIEMELRRHHVCIDARGARLRFGPHFYNTPSDIDACLAALRTITRS